MPMITPTTGSILLPTSDVARVVLKPRRAAPFYGRHPWVLDSAIAAVEGDVQDGDEVDLVSAQGKWIARGVINRNSRIRVRLYSWKPGESLDDSFFKQRLIDAARLRSDLKYDDPRGAARVFFSEADRLSGLIIDRYADYLVVQVTSLAILTRLDRIMPLVADVWKPRGIVLRGEKGTKQLEGIDPSNGCHWGRAPEGPIFIEEHGLRYGVDLVEGQKTGFYLDQRENRLAAAGYFAGRHVLDVFCYSGGFSLAAAHLGGARQVIGIDASAKALSLARANASLNSISNVRFDEGEGFETLSRLARFDERFGAVVLDPPKFVQRRGGVKEALRAYHRLNRQAVTLLEPGGILVTCCCSGHVSREDFLYMLVGVAQKTGRSVQILEQRGASADHPISATCLETEYLKCFICRVV